MQGPVVVLEGLGGQMPILVKPFLFLIAFGPLAVLFASVFGLACLLLMTCVRAIAWLPKAATELLNAVNPTEPRRAALYLGRTFRPGWIGHKPLNRQA
jgi:hypothetical protein